MEITKLKLGQSLAEIFLIKPQERKQFWFNPLKQGANRSGNSEGNGSIDFQLENTEEVRMSISGEIPFKIVKAISGYSSTFKR